MSRQTSRSVTRASLYVVALVSLLLSGNGFADYSAPGKLVEVNSHKVHIHCTGRGLPTVVLEAGLGGTSLEWVRVQRQLSRHTRVCSYDRPGYGWSELTTAPRDAATIAAELKDLLVRSGEPGPYILAGHSLGGHIIRLFASNYSDRVAGLVLVDASHEDMFDLLDQFKSESKKVAKKQKRRSRSSVPQNLPAELKVIAGSLMNQFQTRFAIQNEARQFRRSAREVQSSTAPPEVPVVVISRGPEALASEGRNGMMAQRWHSLQQDLHERLSKSKHIIASASGHYPHLDQPGLVSSTILAQVKTFNYVWLGGT